jgi:DNA-binding CsgD family transcriptional regulator
MNKTPNTTSRLSRKEWYAALLFAHGATPNESANALLVRPSRAEKLAQAARLKLGVGSHSQVRRVLAA